MVAAALTSGRRRLVIAAFLTLLLAGCASGEDPRPGAASSSAPIDSTTVPSDSDGVTTESDSHPTWSAIDGLEMPRDDFGSAVVGTDIWVMGGMTGARGNRLVSIEVLDTATGSWDTSEVEMPVGVASFEVVSRGPLIYGFGGFDASSEATDFAAVLDTRTGTWRDLPPLPTPRYAHTVTRFGGQIYVIGGRDADGEVSQVDAFDLTTERWDTLARPMPRARDSHKTVATPVGLVVAGGQREYDDSELVDLFDPATGRWRSLPDLPEKMSRPGLAYAGGNLWIMLHESAYVARGPVPTAWEEGNALTLSRHGMGVIVLDGFIYSIAGCALNPLRDVRTVDRLELD